MNAAQHILILALRVYRGALSPVKAALLGPSARCRFTPSCSQYGLEAIQHHGAFSGSWLAVKRVCRCHPWGGCGHDPVPERAPKVGDASFRVSRSGGAEERSEHSGLRTAGNQAR